MFGILFLIRFFKKKLLGYSPKIVYHFERETFQSKIIYFNMQTIQQVPWKYYFLMTCLEKFYSSHMFSGCTYFGCEDGNA